ncbi:hypothetical protein O181_064203 [Austropuccinia psidii MF-1]|uniref:Uncharacterized protein n=1 Tax=Austropuccinia psidii MF-1 TaxID=1389203 RepID=A0A9Q3ET25_9BASI|nr:hypothetical protein [Austropuccinia psidii MF-1]
MSVTIAGSANYYYTKLNSTVSSPSTVTKGRDAIISNIDILRVTQQGRIGIPEDALIVECLLRWCIRTYAAALKPESIFEPQLKITKDLFWGDMKSGRRMHVDLNSKQGENYTVSIVDMEGTQRMISALFTTSMASQLSRIEVDKGFSIAAVLSKSQNIPNILEAVATSMTNRLRAGRNLTKISGQSWTNETFIQVDWPFFALPFSLFLLTAVLLQVSMSINRRERLMLWKFSLLPYLFHGLDDKVCIEKYSKCGMISQMEDASKKTKTRLEHGQNGAKLYVE